ncbi:MAG: DUF420 domain-containing protein [Elusimicrobia bacterium]|nr:DUF420 domain-containing protein [Elusimicrobiota bacterium]
MPSSLWPAFNAFLNGACAVLLAFGYWSIRTRRVERHRAAMVGAFSVSCVFLASYLLYHLQVGSVRFEKQGLIRTLYFTILLSHTVLALGVVPLSLRTLYLAARGRFEEHRRWARWALPLWMYVSVTGVVVYWMLYRL